MTMVPDGGTPLLSRSAAETVSSQIASKNRPPHGTSSLSMYALTSSWIKAGITTTRSWTPVWVVISKLQLMSPNCSSISLLLSSNDEPLILWWLNSRQTAVTGDCLMSRSMTERTASRRHSGVKGLRRKSIAPLLRASRAVSIPPKSEMMSTFADGSRLRISPSSSMPVIPGILKSVMTRSVLPPVP